MVCARGGPFGLPFGRLFFLAEDYRNLWQVLERHSDDVRSGFFGIVPQVDGVALVDLFDYFFSDSPIVAGFLF